MLTPSGSKKQSPSRPSAVCEFAPEDGARTVSDHLEDRMAKQSSPNKKKPTARAAAMNRSQRTTGSAKARAGGSNKQVSQSRYPGETPLTGEDRPATRPGGKKRG